MPLHNDYKAAELITDVGGNAEGPEELLTVDEYLMPLRWTEDEKKNDEVLCVVIYGLNKHIKQTCIINAWIICLAQHYVYIICYWW